MGDCVRVIDWGLFVGLTTSGLLANEFWRAGWKSVVPFAVVPSKMQDGFFFVEACRVSPRRARYFLLRRQKKVPKEKATLQSALRGGAGNSDRMRSACATVCACKRKLLRPQARKPLREAKRTRCAQTCFASFSASTPALAALCKGLNVNISVHTSSADHTSYLIGLR